jgi:hypothetical protein
VTIDCIAGYHLNPWTCGIAKFNAILGERLGVPVVSVLGLQHTRYERPLLSVKLSEFSGPDVRTLDAYAAEHAGEYEVFFHAFDGSEPERRLLLGAAKAYCGNGELFHRLRDDRPDLVELWCPGTILHPLRFARADLTVFTFGMAHKIRVPLYRRLRELLDATGQAYSVYVSTALHENTSFDGSFVVTFEELQAIFGDRVYFLGYLSDTAVYNHLLEASLLAAFFERGLRANNTTVNAAMECGCAVLTNLDEHSPPGLVHLQNVIDINRCDRLPGPADLAQIGRAAREIAQGRYGWARLVAEFKPAEVATGNALSSVSHTEVPWHRP